MKKNFFYQPFSEPEETTSDSENFEMIEIMFKTEKKKIEIRDEVLIFKISSHKSQHHIK